MDIRPPTKKPKQLLRARDEQHLLVDHIKPGHRVSVPFYRRAVSRLRHNLVTTVLASLGLVLLAMTTGTVFWYNWAIEAPSDVGHQIRVVVEPGDTVTRIANTLHEHDLIRSRLAFSLYAQLSGKRSQLQAGGYVLSPDQDVAAIVEHMASGKTDEINLTIPPGLTLDELRTHFKKDGFTDEEITSALTTDYTHPLLTSRPPGADLEGYLYPETYRMNADQSLEALFTRSFDQMLQTMQEKGYLQQYQSRNLTIHEAVTLASIVQKEVKDPADQKQVSQVFLKRLKEGVQLGSDVTYMYAAEKQGVRATPGLESPYNTRKYAGLPPGPIANMNPSALEAVALPAPGDFLYFVAGDDGKTYFSRTEAEHEANISAHCHTLCR